MRLLHELNALLIELNFRLLVAAPKSADRIKIFNRRTTHNLVVKFLIRLFTDTINKTNECLIK